MIPGADAVSRGMGVVRNALSFDVEDYFQVHNFEGVVKRCDWGRYPSRVVANTRRILALLAESNTRATFFVLGWVAERFPALVREIAERGHEVASHGYAHQLVFNQTPREFADDLDAAHRAICKALAADPSSPGERRLGYRAPSFSITPDSLWALEILEDKGFLYDSSVSPSALRLRSPNARAPRFPTRVRARLMEFPVSTISVGATRIPVAGGGYFRIAPLFVTRRAIQSLNADGHAAVVYLHPWEFDPAQPRIHRAPALSRFRHYLNLSETEPRLRRLLEDFEFAPLREVFRKHLRELSCNAA